MILALLLALAGFGQVTRTIDVPLGYGGGIAWQPITMQGIPFTPSRVDVSYTINTAWQLGFENTSAAPMTVTFGAPDLCTSGIEMRLVGSPVFFSRGLALPAYSTVLPSYDGTFDLGGTSGFTTPWLRAQTRENGTASPLAGFANTFPITVQVHRFNHWSLTATPPQGAYAISNLVRGQFLFTFYP